MCIPVLKYGVLLRPCAPNEAIIEYNFERRDVGEDGHLCSAQFEKKAAEQAFIELDDYIKKEINHA